ncbi:MAG: 2-C-methyl-D-erythritol 2,4-cyclodiphosphate synthase [Gammaproteobacteria bacterium]|nr:2-C-methyl-D-erythritol 2,4-cyclodiphosphate synthase [Gammaproteobacteria bacterium]
MRVGYGYDAHAFAEGRRLVLGGIVVPYAKGLAAHSDGDVLIHAVCDALLGAAGLGDIGRIFPDTDVRYHDIDSRVLLQEVVLLLRGHSLGISNIDSTIVAQAPRLAPHIEDMRKLLADDLGMDVSRLNIKAKTTEGMGYIGRSEGIEAHAVVMLKELQPDTPREG